jgi:hypothetical protein
MAASKGVNGKRTPLWYGKLVFACLACGLCALIIASVILPFLFDTTLGDTLEEWIFFGFSIALSPIVWRFLK